MQEPGNSFPGRSLGAGTDPIHKDQVASLKFPNGIIQSEGGRRGAFQRVIQSLVPSPKRIQIVSLERVDQALAGLLIHERPPAHLAAPLHAHARHRARVHDGSLSALYRQYIGNDAARGRMSARAYTDDALDPEPRTHA